MRLEADGKIPVILDTDIGSDIDDTWALAMLLNCDDLDVKLIVTAHADTRYRAKIVAKYLEETGYSHIPIGIGPKTSDDKGTQLPWVAGYELAQYPGGVTEDGIAAMTGFIMSSDVPVTIISIGPMTNIAEALDRCPGIVQNARLIGMQGSIFKGYNGAPEPVCEYNVYLDPEACRKSFVAGWEVTITPIDTCGLIKLSGEKYRKVKERGSKITNALMENYRIWEKDYTGATFSQGYEKESTILYDTAAVYLAFSEELLEIHGLDIAVSGEGRTCPDPGGSRIRCAVGWKDLSAFEDLLADIITK